MATTTPWPTGGTAGGTRRSFGNTTGDAEETSVTMYNYMKRFYIYSFRDNFKVVTWILFQSHVRKTLETPFQGIGV